MLRGGRRRIGGRVRLVMVLGHARRRQRGEQQGQQFSNRFRTHVGPPERVRPCCTLGRRATLIQVNVELKRTHRSAERRVGKECGMKFSTRWSPILYNKNNRHVMTLTTTKLNI